MGFIFPDETEVLREELNEVREKLENLELLFSTIVPCFYCKHLAFKKDMKKLGSIFYHIDCRNIHNDGK